MNGEQDMTEATDSHSEADGMSREEKLERRLRRIRFVAVLVVAFALFLLPLWSAYDYLFVYRIPKGTTVIDISVVEEHSPWFDYFFKDRRYEKYWPYLYYRHYIVPEGATEILYGAFTGKKMRSVSLPDSLKRIENGSFVACTELREIDWPESLTEMEGYMFVNCEKLSRVRLPAGLRIVGPCSFEYCSSLCEVKLPAKLVRIEPCLFVNCTGLRKIEIPDGVKDVGHEAFSGCTGLEEIAAPDAERIGDAAFENCAALKKVVLSRNVREIGPHVFSGCTALKTIAFSDGEQAVNYRAFRKCVGLKNVKFQWSTPGGNQAIIGYRDFMGTVPPEDKNAESASVDGWILDDWTIDD